MKNLISLSIYSVLSVVMFLSCSSPQDNTSHSQSEETTSPSTESEAIAETLEQEIEGEELYTEEVVEYSEDFPIWVIHEDDQFEDKPEFVGGNNWYYVIDSEKGLEIIQGEVGIEYEETEFTSFALTTAKSGSSFIIAGLHDHKNMKLSMSGSFETRRLQAGDTNKINFNDEVWYLTAEGEMGEYGGYSHYKVFLNQQLNDGTTITQLLAEDTNFDDAQFEYQWCGDIDLDYKPDFIIDISRKYSYSHPVLFLSSEAEEGKLVKMRDAVYTSPSGC